MKNSTILLVELLEKEKKRDYHFKWFVIDLIINLFFSWWLLPLLFIFLFGLIGRLIGNTEGLAGGLGLGVIIGYLSPLFYAFAWIYHLVKWLNARSDCEELNRKRRLMDSTHEQRERERERELIEP